MMLQRPNRRTLVRHINSVSLTLPVLIMLLADYAVGPNCRQWMLRRTKYLVFSLESLVASVDTHLHSQRQVSSRPLEMTRALLVLLLLFSHLCRLLETIEKFLTLRVYLICLTRVFPRGPARTPHLPPRLFILNEIIAYVYVLSSLMEASPPRLFYSSAFFLSLIVIFSSRSD